MPPRKRKPTPERISLQKRRAQHRRKRHLREKHDKIKTKRARLIAGLFTDIIFVLWYNRKYNQDKFL
jgi:hypothetical protein